MTSRCAIYRLRGNGGCHNHPVDVTACCGKREQGMIYTEYALATLVLVMLLFFPVPWLGDSAVELVISSIDAFYRNSAYLVSLP